MLVNEPGKQYLRIARAFDAWQVYGLVKLPCVSFARQSRHQPSVEQGGPLRRVELYMFLKMFEVIFISFEGFRTILMVLAVWATFFKLEWCRNHLKKWAGEDF